MFDVKTKLAEDLKGKQAQSAIFNSKAEIIVFSEHINTSLDFSKFTGCKM